MSYLALDPALSRLMWLQASSRGRHAWKSLQSPRRVICSLLALVLGAVWVGQTVAASLFRAPSEPATVRRYIATGLLAYAIWIALKTVFRTPVEPFEWTPAEQEWLLGAPLARVELIKFRLRQIACATLVKSWLFVVVMLADLHSLPCAVAGIAAALLSIDLIRMAGEVVVHGLSCRERRKLQWGLGTIVGGGLVSALVMTWSAADIRHADTADVFRWPSALVHSLGALLCSPVGQLVRWPFDFFARTILADRWWNGMTDVAIGIALVAGMMDLVVRLDRFFWLRCRSRERATFADAVRRSDLLLPGCAAPNQRLFVPAWWHGAGAIAWRQWRGAVHYRLALILPLAIAGFLSLLPLCSDATGLYRWAQVVGSLAFYSFVLLPSALRFDFRRDVDRIAVLKALPASPSAVVAGQLAVPVLLCCALQGTVLGLAWVIHPIASRFLVAAVLVLMPVTLFIFVVENLVYLLFPYRLNQEGLGVFGRSILVFTGKTVMFGAGVLASIAMLFGAKAVATRLMPHDPQTGLALFFAFGMWLLLSTVLGVCWAMLVRVYDRFDVSCDGPSMS